MAYVTSIVPEVLAYPYFALCSWLAVRALASGQRAATSRSPLVVRRSAATSSSSASSRPLPVAFAIAGAGLWVTGAARPRRSAGTGRAATRLGAVVLLDRRAHPLQPRRPAAHPRVAVHDPVLQEPDGRPRPPGRALAHDRAGDPAGDRRPRLAAAAASGAATRPTAPSPPGPARRSLCLALYTAVKAAYLSTNFATLWEERNLIYLAPLLLIGTALVFEAKRIDWRRRRGGERLRRLSRAGQAVPARLPVLRGARLRDPRGRSTATGTGATTDLRLAAARRARALGRSLLALRAGARRRRGRRPCSLLAWLLAGEIAMTVGIDNLANAVPREPAAAQLDWVDARDRTGSRSPTSGRRSSTRTALQLTEFWNRSIDHVDSLDGTAPGPGPTVTPTLISTRRPARRDCRTTRYVARRPRRHARRRRLVAPRGRR